MHMQLKKSDHFISIFMPNDLIKKCITDALSCFGCGRFQASINVRFFAAAGILINDDTVSLAKVMTSPKHPIKYLSLTSEHHKQPHEYFWRTRHRQFERAEIYLLYCYRLIALFRPVTRPDQLLPNWRIDVLSRSKYHPVEQCRD